MRTKPFHVAIVGAGPGGLCLAQGLRKHGISCDVYERDHAANSRTQGYRIRIDQTGQEALAACLSETSYTMFQRTCALPPAGVNVLDDQLRSLSGRWVNSWKQAPAGSGDADRCAHRQAMREVLMGGFENHIHFGKALSRYEERGDGVILHFTDGAVVDTDLLVGADGIHSSVRRQLLPGHAPLDTGSICIYGKIPTQRWDDTRFPNTLLDSTSIIFAGDTSVIVDAMRFAPSAFDSPESATRLSHVHDYLYWAIIGTRQAFGCANGAAVLPAPLDARALVHRATRSWSPALKTVFDASDPASMIAASIYGTASVPLWNTGRTTLLGDAIHAMSPAGGLGANTALNDARVLTECLADTDNDKSSLLASVGRYEEAMRAYGSFALRASNASAKALFDAM